MRGRMPLIPSISVVIPTLPKRDDLLGAALKSVYDQLFPAREICIAVDSQREGAAKTRQRALELATCEWVAFLDDDDEMLPMHLNSLVGCAEKTGADYVFSWFMRAKGGDPLGHFGKVFNPAVPHHTTMTVMVRRELALEAGFVNYPGADDRNWSGEDWQFTLRCIELGAKIVHHPEETWIWRRHSGNSSGVVGKGDAR